MKHKRQSSCKTCVWDTKRYEMRQLEDIQRFGKETLVWPSIQSQLFNTRTVIGDRIRTCCKRCTLKTQKAPNLSKHLHVSKVSKWSAQINTETWPPYSAGSELSLETWGTLYREQTCPRKTIIIQLNKTWDFQRRRKPTLIHPKFIVDKKCAINEVGHLLNSCFCWGGTGNDASGDLKKKITLRLKMIFVGSAIERVVSRALAPASHRGFRIWPRCRLQCTYLRTWCLGLRARGLQNKNT